MKIGYLGPVGTFTEQATRRYLADRPTMAQSARLLPFRTIPDLLRDVEAGNLDAGVVPIENSIEGSVAVTLDALIHEVDLEIVAEVVLPVVHHLMAKPGTALGNVEAVVSHPQALAQCRKKLDKLLPGVAQFAATSTAEAAQHVASEDRLMAALGTALAAELYGLEILESHLEDSNGNATRFVVVGRESGSRSGSDKTSVVFAFRKDRPGNLHRALGSFADRRINLTKLESRPAKQSLGQYLFLVDMEGHITDSAVQGALDEIRGSCALFKVLGSFPRVDYHVVPSR